MREEGLPLSFYGIVLAGFVCFAGYAWMQSDDPAPALRALEAEGLEQPKVIAGHSIAASFYGCDKNDSVAYEAEATNRQGKRSKFVVCCGAVLKACTVRIP